MDTFNTSEEYYNNIASSYEEKALKHYSYLSRIESIICNKIKISNLAKIKYLDIACGNGARALNIIKKNPNIIHKAILIDNSIEMIKLSKSTIKGLNHEIEPHHCDFLMFESKERFELITTLWNVYGHIETPDLRKEWLKKSFSLLENGGLFIFDVNNRYNLEYGLYAVIKNIVSDLLGKNKTGRYPLVFKDIKTEVYIHNPFELDHYIRDVGFKIERKIYVSYKRGNISHLPAFYGQLCYILRK